MISTIPVRGLRRVLTRSSPSPRCFKRSNVSRISVPSLYVSCSSICPMCVSYQPMLGHEPRLFSTWGARMIALIGRLPPTLEDRAIVLPMRRRAPGETVERIRRDGLLRRLEPLRRRAARWVVDHLAALQAADPPVPDALNDRQADNWRPLLAIADAAGGGWGDRARVAARTLAGAGGEADPTAPVELLADLQDLFAATAADKLATAAIIRHLITLEERPWTEYAEGRPLTPRHL